jgi:hypothetical protein
MNSPEPSHRLTAIASKVGSEPGGHWAMRSDSTQRSTASEDSFAENAPHAARASEESRGTFQNPGYKRARSFRGMGADRCIVKFRMLLQSRPARNRGLVRADHGEDWARAVRQLRG